jgi:chlorite dismutase
MPDRRAPPPTAEGWYALHDFRTVDWDAWRDAHGRDRERALAEAVDRLEDAVAVDDADEGATACYSILGHEADLLVLHLRPTSAHLDALQRRFERTEFAAFTDRADSYVSVTEASGSSERARDYFEGDLDPDSGLAKYIRSRLYPPLPDAEHVCFYPMDKRRDPEQNWYDLPFQERAEHMDAHGDIGRDYGGKVTQMITGSMGLDDWEWGVTLWADDLTDVKDLLYEMRFDPSTSQFTEFGTFHVGRRFPPADLPALLAGEAVPAAGDASGASERARSAGEAEGRGGPQSDATGTAGRDHGDGAAAAVASREATDEAAASADDAADDGDEAAASADGGERPDVSADLQEVDDLDRRLAILGLHDGSAYDAGDYAVVCYSEADATDLAEATEDLASSFDHYDRHVDTRVRAQQGRAAAVSIWTAKDAAETAAGFMGDLPGITETVGGSLGEDAGSPESASGGGANADPAHAPATDEAAADEAADVREALADLDIYAGRPHGEDVFALTLYSTAEPDDLFEAVADLREAFDRYDSHVRTAVYEDADAGSNTAAVVSLWHSERGADRAGQHLADLPGIVEKPADRDGFGTMGMFYTVEPEHREDFLAKFEEVGGVLDDVDGHRETALLANREDENDMFIASRWDSKADALEFFRSEAFARTVDWGRDVLADRPRHVFLA